MFDLAKYPDEARMVVWRRLASRDHHSNCGGVANGNCGGDIGSFVTPALLNIVN